MESNELFWGSIGPGGIMFWSLIFQNVIRLLAYTHYDFIDRSADIGWVNTIVFHKIKIKQMLERQSREPE